MGLPRSYNTQVALFVTTSRPVPSDLLSKIREAATNEALDKTLSLHILTDDGQGHDFKGWSHDRVALWAVQQFGSADSQHATGAIVVLDDEGVAEQYVEIVGLDLDWDDHFPSTQRSHAFIRGEVLEGLVIDTVKVAFKYALYMASLIDQDCWKGIEFYKECAEEGNQGVLRHMDGELDPEDYPEYFPQAGEVDARHSLTPDHGLSDASDIALGENNSTIPQPVYRTSSNEIIVLFENVGIGEPVWDDVHGSQTIVEKVHDDFSVYWKEQNLGAKPDDITERQLQC